ncbi:DUF397 domain-containing protein [Streptomyces sp. NBC_01808]|uniref:DUF397 domain-containing protein n=1 Tax=Streptomyces sp. NBC_01808 TaxID=2975947 RepID=UPI002DDBD1A0|nr:DUF397 domain-containing protein [Streptomyces sp. NBC_01808]WSA40074.1 DUF397 domain-containing protein [Streptomyces sp. NBC_01808]
MIIKPDLTNATWAKSALSSGGQNCLEVAFIDGVVALRDSKDIGNPEAQVLILSEDDYRAFTGGIQNGQSNLLLP